MNNEFANCSNATNLDSVSTAALKYANNQINYSKYSSKYPFEVITYQYDKWFGNPKFEQYATWEQAYSKYLEYASHRKVSMKFQACFILNNFGCTMIRGIDVIYLHMTPYDALHKICEINETKVPNEVHNTSVPLF